MDTEGTINDCRWRRLGEAARGQVACWLNFSEVPVALLDAAGKTGR